MPNVSVEVRIRPNSRNVIEFSNNKITVGSKIYTFSKVHNRISQNLLFNTSVTPFVERFISGENCTILAYGQTGSGKTYTMGLSHLENVGDKGIIQNSLEMMFKRGLKLSCSFIEIYNENIYDLMNEARIPLNLRQGYGDINIVGLKETEISTFGEVMTVLRRGNENRTTKTTKMNLESSRSHAMLIITLKQNINGKDIESKMTFVDLAGSERLKRSECTGNTAKESISINSGLLSLGNVINALYLKKPHIPFRDSKLTRILEKCLNGYVLLIACVSGLQDDIFETMNTLKYASRAALISLNKKVYIENDKDKQIILNLKKEISGLKDENNRLRAMLNTTAYSNEKILMHPMVIELMNRLKKYESNMNFSDNNFNINIKNTDENINIKNIDENINISNINNIKNFSNDINTKNTDENNVKKDILVNIKNIELNSNIKTDTNKDITTDITTETQSNIENPFIKNENGQRKRTRVVSFNLEPRTKSVLFTPLKECYKASFRLIEKFEDQSSLSFLYHKSCLIFNTIDSKIKSIENNTLIQNDIASDESIRCLYSYKDTLFYTSRSLLKRVSDSGRSLPVYAYKNAITAIFIINNLAFTGHEDGVINILDLNSNKIIYYNKIHNSAIFDIILYEDKFFSCSRDHSVKFNKFIFSSQQFLDDFITLSPPHYDSVGKLLYFKDKCVSLGRDCAIKVWNDNNPFKTVPYAHESWIKCGSSTNRYFVTGCKNGIIKFWDFIDQSVRCIGRIEIGSSVNCVCSIGNEIWIGTQNKKIYKYNIIFD